MRRALALLFVLLTVLAVWLATRHGEAPSVPTQTPAPAAQTPAPPAAKLEAPAQEEPRVEAAAQAEPAPVVAPQAAKPESKLAELRGRFVLEGGAPAVGTKVQVHGWESNNERVMKYGRPKEPWKELTAACDADGRFSLRFDPPRAYQFTLDASYPGCVTAKWRWGEIEPGSTKDLGETLLPRGGAVVGRVVDAQGKSTHDAWQVYADALGVAKGDGSDSSRSYTAADKETGQFRLEGLPPGEVELKAHSELANWIEGPKVAVRAGETTEANIAYTGPDNSRRITVVTFARPFYIFDSDVNEIVLSAPGLEPRKAQKIARSSQSFSFDDLEPGSYSVTIDDPKFKPWRQDGVHPGQQVRAKLQGASAVSLAVVDAATRAPVARYALRARFDTSRWSPNEFEVFGAEKEPPAGGLVEGLIPAEQTLTVIAEGYAPCAHKLEDLKAGEVRPLAFELRKGATLVAHVLQSDGKTPIAGLTVTLGAEQQETNDHPGIVFRAMSRDKQREATSAADGSATFAAVAAGTWEMHVEATPSLATDLGGVVIGDLDTRKDVDLVLPPNGWLSGRVLGLEANAAEGCSLVILPLDLGAEDRSMLEAQSQFDGKGPQNPVAVDGSFRAGPLRAGKSSVAFQFPSTKIHNGPNSSWGQPGARIDLGELEIPAGGELQREFDLRGKLPGRVEADVRVNGAPAANVRVSARSADETPRNGTFDLDTNGHGTSPPIAAGPVRFDIGSSEGDWSWSPPGIWTIGSGQTLHVAWDVPLAAGSLQLLDAASDKPLAQYEVSISAEADADFFASWIQRTTDAQGKIDLRLVPAAYRLDVQFLNGPDGRPAPVTFEPARFDWTASGPANAVLKLAKKP